MASASAIEWTGFTWNPVTGCTKISPGCKNCYAEVLARRLQRMGAAGYDNGFHVTLHRERIKQPLKRKKPSTWFVNSMSDLFHEEVPFSLIDDVLATIESAPQHIFQILTKRPHRMEEFFTRRNVPSNAWLGVSVEDRRYGLPRIPILLRVKAGTRFLSCEPLLEDLGRFDLYGIHWVIVGGESGTKARPLNADWARALRDLCTASNVPFFFKQWGGRTSKAGGRTLDGQRYDEMPSVADAFTWSAGASPTLEAHSDAKLRVFRGYLRKYLSRLTINPAMDFLNLSLVDGFCGGGTFSRAGEIVVGTPLIMLEEVERAQERLNRGRHKILTLNVKFYFIDINQEHLDHLRSELAKRGNLNRVGIEIQLIGNSFDNALPDVLSDIYSRHRRGRSIFLLDQCGYTHVTMAAVRAIFSKLPAAEIILTFAADALVNFLNERPDFMKAMLPVELSEQRIPDLIEMGEGRGGRALVQRVLRDHLKKHTGAEYDTPFFIRPSVSRRALWFVHLSNHPTARDVMLTEHWSEGNTFIHHGPGDLGMLGFDSMISGDLFDFTFDDDAAQRTRRQLLNQIPEEVARQTVDAPITLDGFHREIANRNAATRSQIETILLELWDAREVMILAANGKGRSRSTRRLRQSDFIASSDAPAFPGFLRQR